MTYDIPLNPGWLIGIRIMAFFNPYIRQPTGVLNTAHLDISYTRILPLQDVPMHIQPRSLQPLPTRDFLAQLSAPFSAQSCPKAKTPHLLVEWAMSLVISTCRIIPVRPIYFTNPSPKQPQMRVIIKLSMIKEN